MSLEVLLDHTCDIYHLEEGMASPGFNLPSSPSFSYPDKPDISGQPCHFHVRTRSTTVVQTAPAKLLSEKEKLTLPPGVDVRLNDKIVFRETGMEYIAEAPRNIRDHQIIVTLKTEGEQEEL